jgi:two-component system, OmpR family, response regulator RegX3
MVTRAVEWGDADRIAFQDFGGSRQRILVVEDEVSYQEALLVGLTREGYHVDVARDGIEAMRRYADNPPDLVLLDVLLPGISGTEVCRRMLSIATVPIIMVSALGTETDIVANLELGATDYVAKPYRLRELVARIRSILRRVTAAAEPAPEGLDAGHGAPADTVEAGPVRVDLARRVVTLSGEPVYLARREFDLLALLLSPPGHVHAREDLIDSLWTGRHLADTRTLDTHVRRLRLKLEQDPTNPRCLVTVRGVGFRFDVAG